MSEQTPIDYAKYLYNLFDVSALVDCTVDPVEHTKRLVEYCLDELIDSCDYSPYFYERTKEELKNYYP